MGRLFVSVGAALVLAAGAGVFLAWAEAAAVWYYAFGLTLVAIATMQALFPGVGVASPVRLPEKMTTFRVRVTLRGNAIEDVEDAPAAPADIDEAIAADQFEQMAKRGITKAELVEQVASQAGLSKGDAMKAVDAALDVIESTLRRGEEVSVTGFGKFTVAEHGARQAVHPETGERIQIAASRAPRFSAGKARERRARQAKPDRKEG